MIKIQIKAKKFEVLKNKSWNFFIQKIRIWNVIRFIFFL